MVHVSSPGKLMISGEWAIIEPGNPCIVTAIDRRIHANLTEIGEKGIVIDMKDFSIKAEADFNGKKIEFRGKVGEEDFEKLIFAQAAIETVLIYLAEKGKQIKNFSLEIWKEPDVYKEDEDRIGFGYFASLMVSVVAGVLKLHDIPIDDSRGKELVFKLAVVAYYFTPGHGGSAYNIATSVYGGTIIYRRFDGEWMKGEFNMMAERKMKLNQLIDKNWPGLFIKDISLPSDIEICVAWTGSPSSTRSMVRQMLSFKKNNPMEYNMLISQIRSCTDYLVNYFRNGDKRNIIETVKKNHDALKQLGQKSGIDIETSELRKLVWVAEKNGGAGKQSGAGRGNYGMAICFGKESAEKIKNQWLLAGITPVDVSLEKHGIMEEK